MQRVDIDKKHIVITIDQLNSLVQLSTLIDLNQTSETSHAMIYMHHIVAHLQRIELRNGHLLIALDLAVDSIAAIAVKYLMIGI